MRSTLTGALLHRRQTVGQFGARLGLDLLDEQPEDLIEQIDMLVAITAGAVEKERGDALQRLGPLFARAVLNDFFKLGN